MPQQILVIDLHHHYQSDQEMLKDLEEAILHACEQRIAQVEIIVGQHGDDVIRGSVLRFLRQGFVSQYVTSVTQTSNKGVIVADVSF